MFARYHLILLICLFSLHSKAQSSYQWQGKITDTAGVGLYPATVQIILGEDTLRAITDRNGAFRVKSSILRDYILWVTMAGYMESKQSFPAPSKAFVVHIPDIQLMARFNDLDPVIVARIRPVTFQPDTVSYHLAAFPVRDGSELEAVVKRLPGIEVDQQGNVIVQGKPVKKVLVNGKEFLGGHVKEAVQTLPAGVVDQLQVIDDYGTKARLTGIKSGEPEKILNIVFNAQKRRGSFGQIQGGSGNQDNYSTGGFANDFANDRQLSGAANISKPNTGGQDIVESAELSYANQWNTKLGGSLNFSNENHNSRILSGTIQDTYYPGEAIHQTQSSNNNAQNAISGLGCTLVAKPTTYSTLTLNTSVNFQKNSSQSNSTFQALQTYSGFSKITTRESTSSSESTGYSIGSDLLWGKVWASSPRRFTISATMSLSANRLNSDNHLENAIASDSISTNSTIAYLVTKANSTRSTGLTTSYFTPLSNISFLEFSYRGQLTQSCMAVSTAIPQIGSGPLPVDSLSQDQQLKTTTHAFRSSYNLHLTKFDITAGFNAQPGIMRESSDPKNNHLAYHYFNLLPFMQFSFKVNKTDKINVVYNTEPGLPSIDQLAPYTNVTNPQYPVVGNPTLKPSLTRSGSFHFEHSRIKGTRYSGFGISLAASKIEFPIITSFTHPKDSSSIIQQTTYLNGATAGSVHADYHLALPSIWKSRIRAFANGGIGHSSLPLSTDGELYTIQNWEYTQSAHLLLIIPEVIETDFEATFSLTRPVYPTNKTGPNRFKTANLFLKSNHFILKYWNFIYRIAETYNSNGNSLQANPIKIDATIQRTLLKQNKAIVSIQPFNLLDNGTGSSQSTSATGTIQTNTHLNGRYFMATIQFKFSRFKNSRY